LRSRFQYRWQLALQEQQVQVLQQLVRPQLEQELLVRELLELPQPGQESLQLEQQRLHHQR
jgi:hypothetical protein